MRTDRFSLEPGRCVGPISWSNRRPVTREICRGVVDGLRVHIFPRRGFAGAAQAPFHGALVKHLPGRKVRRQRSFAQPSQLLGEATEKGNKKAVHSPHRVIASSFEGAPCSASIALRLEENQQNRCDILARAPQPIPDKTKSCVAQAVHIA